MKENKVKLLAVLLGIALLVTGGLFYYASMKLKPDEIKKIAIEQTKKIFPKSEVQLEKVDIAIGLNFKINLEKFKIEAVKDGNHTEMLAVDKLVVKVPIWAILTNSGVIEVQLDSPMINYSEFTESNNWVYSMGDLKGENSSAANSDESGANSSASESAVGLFGKSKINVKLADIKVKYNLRDNSNGEIKVSKFVIKGLNFENSTAFELQSSANFIMKDKSTVSFNTLAIGQFNISDLVHNGSVNSNINVKLNNISKTGLDMKFPDIVTDIDVLLKKDGEVTGKIRSSFEGQNKITANFKMAKQIEISEIDVDIFMKDIAAIIGLGKNIDMTKSKLISKGNVLYTNDKKINPNLTFTIQPGIMFSMEGISSSTTVSGEMKGSDLSGKAKTEILGGSVVTSISGEYDVNQKFEMTKLKPFEIRVVATGMKVPEKLIRAKLWDKKEKVAEVADEDSKSNSSDRVATKKAVEAGLPPSNINLDWSGVSIGGEDFSGHGRIVTSMKTIAIDNVLFKFSKGNGKLTQTMTLGKNNSESKFLFDMQGLNLSSFKAFLPPFVENFTGTFTGKVTGSATIFSDLKKLPTYDVNVVADAKKGEIKKLNVGEFINPMLANIPVVKDQVKDKQLKIDGNFETFTMKGNFTNTKYAISTFDFVGLDKKVQITGSGEIYPIAGKNLSVMDINYIDGTGKISEILLKNMGTKILPMHLTGAGFDLKPDYGFTVSKLAKGAVKTKGEEKLKEVVQKNIEKLVPENAKEKVKGILNGLFKK